MMKRKAAWAAAGMIPALIAANFMPRFVLYAFSAALVLAAAILAFFRFRGRMIRTFFLTASACVAVLVFLVNYERICMPIRQYDQKKISAEVVFVSGESNYWTVRIRQASCNNKRIGLTGAFAVSIYDYTIEPYDVAEIEFTLNKDPDETATAFSASDLVINQVYHPQTKSVEEHLYLFRRRVVTMIQTRISGEEGNLAAAFLTGEKIDLSDITQTNFRRTGLSHIMAVSGLHLSIFIGMLSYLLDRFSVNGKIISAISLLFIGIVVVLAGFSVSVIRAGLMSMITLTGHLCNRRADSLNSLCVSLIGIALISPFSIVDASYLLSGAATAGILILSPLIEEKLLMRLVLSKNQHRQLSLIGVSVSSTIFTAPILIIYFREMSILSVPAMSIVNYPVTIMLIGTILFCCLFWMPFLGDFLAFLIRIVAQFILEIVDMLSSFDQATISFSSLPMIIFAILIGMLAILVHLLRHRILLLRIASFICLGLMMLSLIGAQFYHYAFSRLIVLGDGGECNIFIDKGMAIVVNCGDQFMASQAQSVLRKHGFDHIDLVLVTGLDSKLVRGIPSLLSAVPAKQVIVTGTERKDEYYRRIIDAANRADASIVHFTQDTQVLLNDTTIELYDLGEHDNNFSVIIDRQEKAIGFFPAVDKQSLIHGSQFSNNELHVNTLITGTCTSSNMINSMLLYLTSPKTVVAQVTGRSVTKLTDQELFAIIGSGAEYVEITPAQPQYIFDYQVG